MRNGTQSHNSPTFRNVVDWVRSFHTGRVCFIVNKSSEIDMLTGFIIPNPGKQGMLMAETMNLML